MKKKISLIIAAAALATLMVVGGTLAWFTDTEEATNVITMGNVDVELEENKDWPTPGGYFVPGDEINKNPIVKNVGKNDALVRAKVTITATDVNNNPLSDTNFIKMQQILMGIIENPTNNVTYNPDWVLMDGYFYYKYILNSGDPSTAIFPSFNLPETLGNEFTNIKININIKVEAIQSDNLIKNATYTVTDIKNAFGTKNIYDYDKK